MSNKTINRRQRRRKIKARIAGAEAAERGEPVTSNPYGGDSPLSHEWQVAHALKLADIVNDGPALQITI